MYTLYCNELLHVALNTEPMNGTKYSSFPMSLICAYFSTFLTQTIISLTYVLLPLTRTDPVFYGWGGGGGVLMKY